MFKSQQFFAFKNGLLMRLVSCCLLAVLAGCSDTPQILKLQGPSMGTTYHVKYVADVSVNSVLVADGVRAALVDVDKRMSTYRSDSELMAFNRQAVGEPFTASDELRLLLEQSLNLSQLSDGAFDITVGPLVNLWGFGAESKAYQVPTAEALSAAFAQTGYQALAVDHDQLIKTEAVSVDLSAIAKGYAVDRVADALEAFGIYNYLVEVGGELRIGGQKPNNEDWLIGIEEPNSEARAARLAIRAPGQGIATSGDYRNYFEKDGVRYSHTINPKTGYPIRNKLASVTVVMDNCMLADGWATLLMVLGERDGLNLARKQGIAAYFIYSDGGDFKSVYTDAFKPHLVETNPL